MTKETQTVWRHRDIEVLVTKGGGKFYIPLSTIDKEELRALRDACNDALGERTNPKEEKP